MEETIMRLAEDMHAFIGVIEWSEWSEEGFPVRLRKFNGNHSLHFGDPSWDVDHRGDFACTLLTGDMTLQECIDEVTNMMEEIEVENEQL